LNHPITKKLIIHEHPLV